MTQAEVIGVLLTVILMAVFAYIAYWTRRVQRLEDTMARTSEQRMGMHLEHHGRLTRLEAEHASILAILTRMEARMDRNEEE